MTDTGPLFVSSGDLIADRRYKWALDHAAQGDLSGAADILTQTVELVYAANDPGLDPPSFDRQMAGIHATVTWKRTSDRAWTRTAELSIDQPLVAQADYVGVRGMLRDWTDHLAR